MTDLDRLIEAVEAGTASTMLFDQVLGGVFCERFGCGASVAEAAYFGSLDAAKALHDALLPGWGYVLDEAVDGRDAYVYAPTGAARYQGDSKTMPRAWLLAILRAVKAKG